MAMDYICHVCNRIRWIDLNPNGYGLYSVCMYIVIDELEHEGLRK